MKRILVVGYQVIRGTVHLIYNGHSMKIAIAGKGSVEKRII
jgi:hypothetical protein